MPTGANNDVIPVTRRTKGKLEAAKGPFTYDDLVAECLRVAPPEVARARLEARRAAQIARVTRAKAPRAASDPRRSPEKQLLIARLAERRWKLWLRDGKVVQLGPRRFVWKIRPPEEPRRARIARPGRGLPPLEGPRLEG